MMTTSPVRNTPPAAVGNPLLDTWTGPFEAPPFAAISVEHFRPAFDAALAEQRSEIDAIAGATAEPSFENTIAALEQSGRKLKQVSAVFFNLAGAHTNEAIQEIERAVAPLLAQHRNAIYLDGALFSRIDDLHGRREALGLDVEEFRVLDRYHTLFRRQGAGLPPGKKERLAAINERLAVLGTQFGQNVLADESAYALVLYGEADLAGLPGALRQAAAKAAADRGIAGKHVITLARSSIEPFLQFSTRRDLRETAFRAWSARGESGGSTDNRPLILETVRLRAERAALLGYPTFAHYRLEDSMARDTRGGAGAAQCGMEAGPRTGPAGRRSPANPHPIGRWKLCARGVGLALLFGAPPQGGARS
jgi:peptidyl-dipeptidase Dcp